MLFWGADGCVLASAAASMTYPLLQVVRPQAISDLVLAAETMRFPQEGRLAQTPGSCTRCGYLSSQPVCKVLTVLDWCQPVCCS